MLLNNSASLKIKICLRKLLLEITGSCIHYWEQEELELLQIGNFNMPNKP